MIILRCKNADFLILLFCPHLLPAAIWSTFLINGTIVPSEMSGYVFVFFKYQFSVLTILISQSVVTVKFCHCWLFFLYLIIIRDSSVFICSLCLSQSWSFFLSSNCPRFGRWEPHSSWLFFSFDMTLLDFEHFLVF